MKELEFYKHCPECGEPSLKAVGNPKFMAKVSQKSGDGLLLQRFKCKDCGERLLLGNVVKREKEREGLTVKNPHDNLFKVVHTSKF